MVDINFGSGPNTASGDVVSAAFTKLQNRVAAAEAAGSMPTLTLNGPLMAAEGNSGTTVFNWTLTLNRNGSVATVPFMWNVTGSGSSPADANDFGGVFPSGSGTFGVGETVKTISVSVSGDVVVEPNETFTLVVVPTLTLASVASVGTITNDDRLLTLTDVFGSDLSIWIDTQDNSTMTVTSGTNAVSAITSKGATPFSVTQATVSQQPILTASSLNTKQSLKFTASAFTNLQGNAGSLPQGDTASTVFTVATSLGTTTQKILAYGANVNANSTSGTIRTYGARSGYPDFGNNGTDHTLASPSPQYNGNNLLVVSQQGSGSDSIWTNGNATPSTKAVTWTTSGSNIVIGKHIAVSNTEGFNGQIGEIAFVNRVVTLTERQQAEGILAWKWGKQADLPSDHPYRNAAPSFIPQLSATLTTAPSVQGSAVNGTTLTATPAVWAGNPTITRRWTRDGQAISGATALTYTYVSSTDDGKQISYEETANGTVKASSNTALTSSGTSTYLTSFSGADNTSLNGYDGWTVQNNDTAIYIFGNDLWQSKTTSNKSLHATGSDNYIVSGRVAIPAGSGDSSSWRYMYARYTDNSNFVGIDLQGNGWSVKKVVGGVTTQLQAYTSRYNATGDLFTIKIADGYARVYINGTETQSATANGGLGHDVRDVPVSQVVGFNGTIYSPNVAAPYYIWQDFSIKTISATSIAIGTVALALVNNTPGRQIFQIPITPKTTVSSLQYAVLSSNNRVLIDWTAAVPVNGVIVTGELPVAAENDIVNIWVRDAAAPSTTAAVQPYYVPINWRPMQADFGINFQGMAPYIRGIAPVDMVKSASLCINYSVVSDPSYVLGAANTNISASTVGLDDYGWPTTCPTGKKVNLVFNDGGRGFNPDRAGTYDVSFPPGFDWYVNSAATHMERTAYDVNAGTAVIVVKADVTGQAAPQIVFNSYNGVANTFPPYTPDRKFTMIKRGEDVTKFLTAKSLASVRGLTSANKTSDQFRGFIRLMTPGGINRGSSTDRLTYTDNRKNPPVNRLGTPDGSPQFSVEEQIAIAIGLKTNLWFNIPDLMPPSEVQKIAQILYDRVPAGMKIVVEWSNEVWNFQFGQFGTVYEKSKTTFGGSGNLNRQYSQEVMARLVTPFEAVFAFNDPRYYPVAGMQAAQAGYGKVKEVLDESNLKDHVKGVCIGPYIAGGVLGKHIGNYAETSLFTKASRDKAGVDDAGFIDDLFVAQAAMSKLMQTDSWNVFANTLAQYAIDNGKARSELIPMCYEFSWQHYNMINHNISATGSITGNTLSITVNNNTPIRIGDVLVGTGITAGTKVTAGPSSGGIGDYTVDISQTVASTTITSSTNLYAQAVGRLLATALRDSRAGSAQVAQLEWLRATGGFHVLFDYSGYIGSLWDTGTNKGVTSGSNWGMMDQLGNEATDDPYKSVAAYFAANG